MQLVVKREEKRRD